MTDRRRLLRGALLAALGCLAASASLAQPQQFVEVTERLRLSAETRLRYETLDGAFRSGLNGGDQGLFLRTLIGAEWRAGRVTLGAELQDARVEGDDSGSLRSTALVNPLDVLQAYVRVEAPGLGQGSWAQVGRLTMDLGGRRFIARNVYRNTVNAFTGVRWHTDLGPGHSFDAFYVVPIGRDPNDAAGLGANAIVGDREQWERRFWAGHYIRPGWTERQRFEVFVYGLQENDTRFVPTPNRRQAAPGFRLFLPPRAGGLDYELESAVRWGKRRATLDPADTRDLDLRAGMVHAEIGYTFDTAQPVRVSLDWDLATGDADPNDGTWGRYDRLFGVPRADLNHTSLYGALARSNIDAPGLRVVWQPTSTIKAQVHVKRAFLDQARDAWIGIGPRDVTGGSGRVLGTQVETRFGYQVVPRRLRLEAGTVTLFNGRFAETAPGTTGEGDAHYGFVELFARY